MADIPSRTGTSGSEVNASSSSYAASNLGADDSLPDESIAGGQGSFTFGRSGPETYSDQPEPPDMRDLNSGKGPKKMTVEEQIVKKRTLYQILGASPTETRDELKKRYIQLAKVSHPDARIGGAIVNEEVDFGEVASAWRVLGDAKARRKYDRTLRAEEFSENAQRFANERLEKAVPAVSQMLDKVAVPFIRRTTATTWAVAQAAAKGVSFMSNSMRGNPAKEGVTEGGTKMGKNPVTEDKNIGLGDAFYRAIEAGQRAGKAIDSIELKERSQELQARAERELERGLEIERELLTVTEKRLFATLQSSNFALSSDEAQQVLERLSMESGRDMSAKTDRAYLEQTIQAEIDSLKEAEVTFSNRLNNYEDTDMEWNEILQEQEKVKQELRASERAEVEARKALERAQRMVEQAKANLVTTSNALRLVEERVKRSALEMDKVTTYLSTQQETVRDALQRNAQIVVPDTISNLTEDDLQLLRRQEVQLMGEKTQIQRMVARLQSRAQKLKNRARALERWQRSNNNNTSNDHQDLDHFEDDDDEDDDKLY